MHTQCREKTKDIDHTFQMVGGQSLVNVNAESLFRDWDTHGKMNTFPSHSPLTKSQQINKYIHTQNITTSWPWPMMWNVAQGDGHSNVGRLSEGKIRASSGASQASGDLSIHMGGKGLQRRVWCSSCGQNSRLDEDSDYCSIHPNEWECDMEVNMRIMMAAVDLVQIYEYNPQNYRLFL